MVTPEYVRDPIAQGIACTHLTVDGDGAHFEAVIVSDSFAGKSRVARHQMVNRALGSQMGNEIHALSMKTLTPDEWKGA
jgi:acid stress-induced BolA-like protein IbaG/YrbA